MSERKDPVVDGSSRSERPLRERVASQSPSESGRHAERPADSGDIDGQHGDNGEHNQRPHVQEI
jgi:hypothetical protein